VSAGRILAALAAAALFGGWAGYTLKGDVTAKAEVKQAQIAVKKSAQNVVVSVAENARIETAVAKVDTNVASIKAAIVKRGVTLHQTQEPHAASSNRDVRNGVSSPDQQPATAGAGTAPLVARGDEDAAACGPGLVLDRGTVGLLNAAREGRGVGAAGSSDEAQSAPSTVGVTDLIANDLDIVQMYLELAKRHDELVDAVEKHLKDQAH
jgi:hypothetical protein